MAYATKEQLRRYVIQSGAIEPPTTDDELFDIYLADAQLMIDGFCHRTFEASANTTRYFDALTDLRTLSLPGEQRYSQNRTLWLGDDICAISSVVNGDGTTVSAISYVTEPRNSTPYYALTLKGSANVTWTYDESPENAIAVTGRWAYSQTADALIRGATLALAAWAYRQKGGTGEADRPLVTGDGVTILPAVLPKHVYERLAARRRLV